MSQTEAKTKLIFEGEERGVAAAAAKAERGVRRFSDEERKAAQATKAAADVDKERAKALSDLSDKLGTAGKWAGLFGVATGAGAAAVGAALPALGSLALGFGIAKAAIGGSTAALDAYDKAMKDGKGDFTEYNRLLKGMTPEQRAFTEAVVATKAPLSELQKTAGRSFLPGVTKFLTDSQSLFPLLNNAVARTGKIMGDTASQLGELFKSKNFQQSLEDMLRSSDVITKAIGDNFVKLTAKVVDFGGNMGPAAAGFATAIDDIEAGLEGFLSGLEPYSADFKSIFESVGSMLKDLLPIVGQLAGELAADLAPILRGVAGFIRENKDAISGWVPAIAAAVLALGGFKIASSVAGWIGGAADALLLFGGKAETTGGKVGGLLTKLGGFKGLLIAGAVAAFAAELDKVNVAAAGGADKLGLFQGQLHNIVGAAGQLASGDIGGIFTDITDELTTMVEKMQSGQSGLGQFFGWLKRQVTEPLPPITFNVDTGPAVGQVNAFINDVNSRAPQVNINGNTNGAGFALREVLAEIAAGKADVTIDGRPMPAQEALKYVIGLINNSVGTANINGNNQPAGQALADFLGRANSASGTATLRANGGPAYETVGGWTRLAEGSVGTAHLHAEAGQANGAVGGWRGTANATVATAHLNANTSSATGAINSWRAWASGIVVTVRAVLQRIGFAGGGPVLPGMATGGPISGPGSGTSDQAGMFALSAGEWVMTAREVRNAGGFAGMARLAAALDRGRPLGLAGGGPTMASSARAAMRPALAPSVAAVSGGGVQVSFAGNTSDALATAIMQMIRTNKIQLKAAA